VLPEVLYENNKRIAWGKDKGIAKSEEIIAGSTFRID
jgi:hypothetical protein